MFSKISHILPYLYYRIYQFYKKHESADDAFVTARILICLIELMYLMIFVIFPLDHICFDGGIGHALRVDTSSFTRFGVILMLAPLFYLFYRVQKGLMDKFHAMMPLWKNESKTRRRVKWWILLVFYAFPFFFFIPEGRLLNYYFPKYMRIEYTKPKARSTESVIRYEKKPLQFEEIDDSHMWGIQKKEKEIRIVEEEN